MIEFNPELFTQLNRQSRFRENTLVDLKRQMYRVRGNDKELAEFIRDMIALANASRRRGEPAYILFGVNDDGTLLTEGIKGQVSKTTKPKGWDDENPSLFQKQQNDIIGRDFQERGLEYITPDVEFEYLAGWIDGVPFSYIHILPSHAEPHAVKKELFIHETGKKLRVGDCWIRRGESKYGPLSKTEKQSLPCYREIPYINKSQWIDHLQNLSKAYEQPIDADELYIPLTIDGTGTPLRDELDGFLGNNRQILVVTGMAGSGKTTFLKQYVGYRASIAQQDMDEEKPLEWVPAFFDLSKQHPEQYESFIKSVVLCFDEFDLLRLRAGSHSQKIFADRNLHFVICFDAFDEVPRNHRDHIAQFIQQFAQEFAHLKIIITSRKGVLNAERFTNYQQIEIASFSESDCLDYFSRYLRTPEELLQWLQSDQLLAKVMDTPLMIKATTEYWQSLEQKREHLIEAQTELEQEQIALERDWEEFNQLRKAVEQDQTDLEERQQYLEQRQLVLERELVELEKTLSTPNFQKGRFAEGVFSQLFEHELKKSFNLQEKSLEIGRLRKKLCELAFWMDGQYPIIPLEKAQSYLNDSQLLTLETLGLLHIHFHNSQVSFANELAKVYFATWEWIRQLEHEGTNPLTQEQLQSEFWQKCLPLALDFLPEEALLHTGEVAILP